MVLVVMRHETIQIYDLGKYPRSANYSNVKFKINRETANNHKYITLIDLQEVLKPIEKADKVEKKFVDHKKKIGGNNSRQHEDR